MICDSAAFISIPVVPEKQQKLRNLSSERSVELQLSCIFLIFKCTKRYIGVRGQVEAAFKACSGLQRRSEYWFEVLA